MPLEFRAALKAGEQAGALEETCARQSANARERCVALAQTLGDWLPRVLYALVALFILIQLFLPVTGIAGSYGAAGVGGVR